MKSWHLSGDFDDVVLVRRPQGDNLDILLWDIKFKLDHNTKAPV